MAYERKRWWRQIIHNFAYGKVDRDFYRIHANLLQESNFTTVRMAYIFASILCLILLSSVLLEEEAGVFRTLYEGITLFLPGMTVLIFTVLKKKYHHARLCYYLFAAAVFTLAIMLGTVLNPDEPAVSFFVLLMIIPLLYVEQPLYSVVMSALASILFCLTAVVVKAGHPEIVRMDITNAVYCFFISAGFIAYIRNSHLKYMQATIIFQTQSETDRLTGISNKASTENLCELYLQTARGISNSALFIIDLDDFKYINDTLGHKQGDVFLNETGHLLKEIFAEKDVVGRIGGDEFLILMKDVPDLTVISRKAVQVGEKIQSIFSDLTVTQFTCSIGISVSTRERPLKYRTMFFQADQALYQAKQRGKNQHAFYSEEYPKLDDKPFMLVVDDSEVSRAILCSCFEEEYKILQAEEGMQALEYMEKYSSVLSVVLLDIEMPLMNGYDVLKKMQADQSLSRIPVLVITAHGTNELQALEYGAVDLITKPFDPLVVKKRVDNARKSSATQYK